MKNLVGKLDRDQIPTKKKNLFYSNDAKLFIKFKLF